MPFLSSESLRSLDPKPIEPFNTDRAKSGTYELSLGPEVYITGIDKTKRLIADGDQVVIPAGQAALLLTEEMVTIPNNLIAFISIKFGQKFRGLVNISGFHVDPGYTGRLKFSVYNSGSHDIVISRGEPLFPIWFAKFDKELSKDDLYNGTHQGQSCITNEDVMRIQGNIPSPHQLHSEIEDVKRHLDTLIKIAIPILVGLIFMIFNWILKIIPPDNDRSPINVENTMRIPKQNSPTSGDSTSVKADTGKAISK